MDLLVYSSADGEYQGGEELCEPGDLETEAGRSWR